METASYTKGKLYQIKQPNSFYFIPSGSWNDTSCWLPIPAESNSVVFIWLGLEENPDRDKGYDIPFHLVVWRDMVGMISSTTQLTELTEETE